jgi:hypothetical protein
MAGTQVFVSVDAMPFLAGAPEFDQTDRVSTKKVGIVNLA